VAGLDIEKVIAVLDRRAEINTLNNTVLYNDGKPIEADRKNCKYAEWIDPGIKLLVRVLQEMGFETFASCEGHWPSTCVGYPRWPYAWVNMHIYSAREQDKALERIAEEYNTTSEVKWIYGDGHLLVKSESQARDLETLKKMHDSAESLALFIHKNISTNRLEKSYRRKNRV